MRNKVGKLLMLLGIIVLLAPIIGSQYIAYQQKKLRDSYKDEISQQLTVLNDSFVSKDAMPTDKAAEVPKEATLEKTPNGLQVVGELSIPKIHISLLLVEGVTNKALKYAAGHMPGTALPGDMGNCAIAGHRSFTFGKYFNRLDELKAGDTVTFTRKDKVYTYKIEESFLVEPTEVWVLDQEKDEQMLTLITCDPATTATHRLIVRGKLVE